MEEKSYLVEDLMEISNVKFGTSGARGLADDMTDEVCYAYTAAFIQHLEQSGGLNGVTTMAVGGDLRPSTDRIMIAAAKAVTDKGFEVVSCGKVPSPALAYYGLENGMPTIMVTGSHIPDDRNGIKYAKKEGEILKNDEIGMRKQKVAIPAGLFDDQGFFKSPMPELAPIDDGKVMYVKRYLDFFPNDCLKGMKVGVYQHSAVGRELLVEIYEGLCADVARLGFSDKFIPVDTEAIRPEDVKAAADWAKEFDFDSIVSTDGDSDRPLVSDEKGKWLRGDVAGILCAQYLKADAVVTPVSCNTALEKCGQFKQVVRTRIGSPYVIEGMMQASSQGAELSVGYEANGGFLINSDITGARLNKSGIDNSSENVLKALPTRDAVIIHIAILLLAKEKGLKVSGLNDALPQRITYSNRLQNFPTQQSKAKLAEFTTGDSAKDVAAIEEVFGDEFGVVTDIDRTDGIRITFASAEIVHLRPSGNAPEFRCYNEADTEARAEQMNETCMIIMETWR